MYLLNSGQAHWPVRDFLISKVSIFSFILTIVFMARPIGDNSKNKNKKRAREFVRQ